MALAGGGITQCSGWALKPGDVDPSLSPGERERERV